MQLGTRVRIIPSLEHPDACAASGQGRYACLHGQPGRVVQINKENSPNKPFYVVGENWGAPFARSELEVVA